MVSSATADRPWVINRRTPRMHAAVRIARALMDFLQRAKVYAGVRAMAKYGRPHHAPKPVRVVPCNLRLGHGRRRAGASFDRRLPDENRDDEERGGEEVRLAEPALRPGLRRQRRSRTGDDMERGEIG